MNNTIRRSWNIYSMVNIEDLRGSAFQAEDGGHTFEITGLDASGNTVALSGTVAAVFLRPDNTDVAISGTVSGGKVYVTLTDECYGYPGRFGLTIYLTSGGQKVAIYAAIGSVHRTSSGAVSPETAQDVVDLINEIEAAIAQIPSSYTDIMAAISPAYSNTAIYPVGAFAWYEGKLYRSITAITTAESWTAAHWELADIGSEVCDLKNASDHFNGNQLAVNTVFNERGYILAIYSRKAWDYANSKMVDAQNVTITDFISYTPGTYLTIVIPSGLNARTTFTKNGSPVANTGWKSATLTFQNSNDVDAFTVEYKYSNGANIADIYSFLNGTAIYIDTYNKKFVPNEMLDQQIGGIFEQLNFETEKSGFVSSRFDFYAWNFVSNTKVSATNCIMSDFIPYEINHEIFVTVPSGVYFRLTFLNGSTILSAAEWQTGSNVIRNSLTGVDRMTVEYKYSDSRDISSIASILNGTSIYIFDGTEEYAYGAYDFPNSAWVLSTAVLHASYEYTNGDYVQIVNKNPSLLRYRLTFFDGNTSKGTTSWLTETFRGRNINGATSISVEIGYQDARTIYDREYVINNFEVNPKPADYILNDITTLGIFKNWATIGDSFSVGRWYENEGGTYIPVRTSWLAWGSLVSREVGNNFLSLGIGGINTRTWLSADPSTGGGLALALASPAQDLYFLCLGINDTSLGSEYIGTVSDIHDADYTQNADTFYGNYGKIIQQMKNHAPNALFIISQLVTWNDSSVKDAYNTAIKGIATHYGIPCIDPYDDPFFSSTFFQDTRGGNNGHPTGMTYGGMAMAYKRLISKCIYDNSSYFVGYNGTADGGV